MDTAAKYQLLRRLKARFYAAQRRARYWSGTPSLFRGSRYKPKGGKQIYAASEYELAMQDSVALADEIAAISGRRPIVHDYKKEFQEAGYRFAANQ